MNLTPLADLDGEDPQLSAVRAYIVAAGGVAAYGELTAASSWRAVKAAVSAGVIVRRRRGQYAISDQETVITPRPLDQTALVLASRRAERCASHRRAAEQCRAARSHRSAAEHYDLPVLVEPPVPELIVPRGRRLPPWPKAVFRRRSLTPAERREAVTTPVRTVLDCAAGLPFEEALAVADSALRAGPYSPALLSRSQLIDALESVPCRARNRVVRVVEAADGRAANPFESAIRALALDVPGLDVQPQVSITIGEATYQVDLGDRALRIVLEGDSYAWHGSRHAFQRDCERYNALVTDDWLVLRLPWRAVRHDQERVRAQLRAVVALRQAQQRFASG